MSRAQLVFYAHLRELVVGTLPTAIALSWPLCKNGYDIDPAVQHCAKFYTSMYHNVYKKSQPDQVLIFDAMKKIQLAHPITIDYIIAKLAELTVMVALKYDLRAVRGRNIPAQELYILLAAETNTILDEMAAQFVPTIVGTLAPEVYNPEGIVTATPGKY